MHKIDWCKGGMQLAYIDTNNVGEHDLTPSMKYIMVRLENWDRTLVKEGWNNTRIVYGSLSLGRSGVKSYGKITRGDFGIWLVSKIVTDCGIWMGYIICWKVGKF